MLSEKALREFIERYEKVFGERLSEAEARSKAERFLQPYRAVYGTADIYTQ